MLVLAVEMSQVASWLITLAASWFASTAKIGSLEVFGCVCEK